MALFIKICIYIVFLIFYALFIYFSNKLTQKTIKVVYEQKNIFFFSLFVSIYGVFFIFLSVWLLTRYYDFMFYGLLIAGGVLGFFVSSILWAVLGSPKTSWGAQILWDGMQIPLRHTWFPLVQIILGIVFLLYPIAAGWIYFSNDVPSSAATLGIFRATLIMLMSGMVMQIIPAALILISASLNEESRSRVLVNKISDFVSYGLIASVILWAFGLAKMDQDVGLGQIPMTLSWIVVIALVALLVLAYILPYVVGVQRRKALLQTLADSQSGKIENILDVLHFPDPLATKQTKFSEIQDKIDLELQNFFKEYPGLMLAADFEQARTGNLPGELETLRPAYEKCREQDPRIQHVEYLDKIDKEIEDIQSTISDIDAGDLEKDALDEYQTAYKSRLEQMRGSKKDEKKGNPKLLLGIVALFGAIIGPTLSGVGNKIWELISSAAVK